MRQMAIAGDDWRSDREIKTQAKAEAARKKAAINCARKLMAASEALSEFLSACNACHDASSSRGLDDGRTLLAANIREYAHHLDSVFNK